MVSFTPGLAVLQWNAVYGELLIAHQTLKDVGCAICRQGDFEGVFKAILQKVVPMSRNSNSVCGVDRAFSVDQDRVWIVFDMDDKFFRIWYNMGPIIQDHLQKIS